MNDANVDVSFKYDLKKIILAELEDKSIENFVERYCKSSEKKPKIIGLILNEKNKQ